MLFLIILGVLGILCGIGYAITRKTQAEASFGETWSTPADAFQVMAWVFSFMLVFSSILAIGIQSDWAAIPVETKLQSERDGVMLGIELAEPVTDKVALMILAEKAEKLMGS